MYISSLVIIKTNQDKDYLEDHLRIIISGFLIRSAYYVSSILIMFHPTTHGHYNKDCMERDLTY